MFFYFQGREKMPTYWIGAFINPQKFLSLFKWEFMMKMANENVTYENISTQTIITGRDKDHVSSFEFLLLMMRDLIHRLCENIYHSFREIYVDLLLSFVI